MTRQSKHKQFEFHSNQLSLISSKHYRKTLCSFHPLVSNKETSIFPWVIQIHIYVPSVLQVLGLVAVGLMKLKRLDSLNNKFESLSTSGGSKSLVQRDRFLQKMHYWQKMNELQEKSRTRFMFPVASWALWERDRLALVNTGQIRNLPIRFFFHYEISQIKTVSYGTIQNA